MDMAIKHSPASLAEQLGISIEALRKQMKRMGLVDGRFNRNKELDDHQVNVLFGQYTTGDSLNLSDSTLQTDRQETGKADKLVKPLSGSIETDSKNGQDPVSDISSKTDKVKHKRQLSVTVSKTDKAPISSNTSIETDKPTNSDQVKAIALDVMLVLIALISMYVQMNHTAYVVAGQPLQAWAYALSIQFTGLAITLFKGSLFYLRVFAVAEFAINLLYYRPWHHKLIDGVSVCGGVEEWVRSILLSALIAFTIYSYVEIFAARRNETDKS